jgi:hypothetical protein
MPGLCPAGCSHGVIPTRAGSVETRDEWDSSSGTVQSRRECEEEMADRGPECGEGDFPSPHRRLPNCTLTSISSLLLLLCTVVPLPLLVWPLHMLRGFCFISLPPRRSALASDAFILARSFPCPTRPAQLI